MNEKDCGSIKIERVLYNDVQAYKITEVNYSYFEGPPKTEIIHYTRNNPSFDYIKETVL